MKARQGSAPRNVRQPAARRAAGRPYPRAYPDAAALERVNIERCEAGITLEEIAAEASKTAKYGTCTAATVSRVLSARTKSQNVLDAYERVKAARARTSRAKAS
jgi:hypothetical protein